LKARINSGKAASTSQADSKPGVEEDSIFADLDTDGVPSCLALRHLITTITITAMITLSSS